MTTHTRAETVSIPLPGITTQRPTRCGAGWRLKLAALVGRGDTQAAAKQHLAEQITLMAATIDAEPAFARDDDGSVIVALDRPWGIEWYKVTDTTARRISTGTPKARPPTWRAFTTTRCCPRTCPAAPMARPAPCCSPSTRSSGR
ncbi:MAG: hypothetical protein JO362_14365 [Streptomycetaceae bacterium]|nr:hypothetical protein [Streptomycetaceae bacterium]